MTKDHSNDRPIIKAASACVWRGEEVLLVQRAAPQGKGLWAFPGGKLESRETALVAAHRELLEETGVFATLEHEVGVFTVELPSVIYEITCFTGTWLQGEAVAASDAGAAKWIHHLNVEQLVVAPNILAALKIAKNLKCL